MENDNTVKKRDLDEAIKMKNKKICSRDENYESQPSTSSSSGPGTSTSTSDNLQSGTTFADDFYLSGTYRTYDSDDSDDDYSHLCGNIIIDEDSHDYINYVAVDMPASNELLTNEFQELVQIMDEQAHEDESNVSDTDYEIDDNWQTHFNDTSELNTSGIKTGDLWEKDPFFESMDKLAKKWP